MAKHGVFSTHGRNYMDAFASSATAIGNKIQLNDKFLLKGRRLHKSRNHVKLLLIVAKRRP